MNPVRTMSYGIAPEVFEKFPEACIGVALAHIKIERKPVDKGAQRYLSTKKQETAGTLRDRGLTTGNYQDTPVCRSWRNVFDTYNTEGGQVCTIENLYRRAAAQCDRMGAAEAAGKRIPKADLGRVSNVVDLTNCLSMDFETPMGVLDISKLEGDMTLRFGTEGETFTPIGETSSYDVTPSQLVISDAKQVLAWLWTYKISEAVCVHPAPNETTVLVCADQAESGIGGAEAAIRAFLDELPNIGGSGEFIGVMNQASPKVTIRV